MIPNLHKIIATALPLHKCVITRWSGRGVDDLGNWVDAYSEPFDAEGDFQPVSARTVKELGFDTTKYYVKMWTKHELSPARGERGADRVEYRGRTYEVVGDDEDWIRQDGWGVYYLVEVDRE